MHSRFRLRPAIGVMALDHERRALDAGFFAVGDLDNLDLEAALLGPADIHPHQHLGPVLALGAAGAGMDLDERVVGIRLAGEQRLDLGALRFAFQAAQRALTFGDSVGITLGIAEFDQGNGVLEFLFETLDRLDLVFQRSAFAHEFLRGIRIIPEIGILGQGVQFGETALGMIPVKDASSAALWTAWRSRPMLRIRRAWYS